MIWVSASLGKAEPTDRLRAAISSVRVPAVACWTYTVEETSNLFLA
jgi:hypothetical protein